MSGDGELYDVAIVGFGPAGALPIHRKLGHLEDVNDDGITDLVTHYRAEGSGVSAGDTEACVTGETFDGVPFASCDVVSTVPACGIGFELAVVLPPLMWRRRQRRRMSQADGKRTLSAQTPPNARRWRCYGAGTKSSTMSTQAGSSFTMSSTHWYSGTPSASKV